MRQEQVSFLETLRLELENVNLTESPDPPFPVETGDHVVGIASEEHKKLYAVWQNYERAGMETGIQARYARGEEERTQAIRRASSLSMKANLIRDLFWISLRDSFDQWGRDIAIKAEWKVVWTETKPPSLLDLLRGSSDPDRE